MAIPIGQGNRPELLRQTLVPAFPPRVLGSDDDHTGRRRRREGGAILNISGGSSILRSEHDRAGERTHDGRAARERTSTPTSAALKRWKCSRAAERLPRRRTCESASGRTSARGRVDGPVASVAFRLICDNQSRHLNDVGVARNPGLLGSLSSVC